MQDKDVRMIYVLLDGVGDLPNPSLGGRTPLEAAKTPTLDALARNGAQGDSITVGEGIAPESDIAVFNMLGYTFGDEYPGRGVIESIGAKVDFVDGDLAMRGNFATLDGSGYITDRRAGRNVSQQDAHAVARELESGVRFSKEGASVSVVPTISHRVSVRIRHDGTALSADVGNTDPAYERISGMGVARSTADRMKIAECVPLTDAAGLSAVLVNEFSGEAVRILGSSQINAERRAEGLKEISCVLLRDAGAAMPKVRPIGEVYGLSFSCIVDMPVEIGIAQVLEMTPYKAGGIEDYEKKASVAAGAIKEHNVMYVHLKGPDEFGHDGDAPGKTENIGRIDSEFFAPLTEQIGEDVVVLVSADHSTPCTLKGHSDDPVPVMVSGGAVKPDHTARMTESEARTGSIGRIAGADVLRTALSMAGS